MKLTTHKKSLRPGYLPPTLGPNDSVNKSLYYSGVSISVARGKNSPGRLRRKQTRLDEQQESDSQQNTPEDSLAQNRSVRISFCLSHRARKRIQNNSRCFELAARDKRGSFSKKAKNHVVAYFVSFLVLRS